MRIAKLVGILALFGGVLSSCRSHRTSAMPPGPVFQMDEQTFSRFQENYYQGLTAKLLGDAVRAIEYFKRASLLNPTDASTHYHLAQLYLQQHNLQFAYRHIQWAVRYAPDNIYYLTLLANLERELGHLDKSEAIYEQLIQKRPQNLDYYNQLLQLAIQQDDLSKALSIIERVEQQFGTNPSILRQKLSIHLFLQQYDEAEKVAHQLLELDPKDIKTLEQLTRLFLTRRDTSEAIHTLQRLLKNHPDKSLFKLELAKLYIISARYDTAAILLSDIANDPTIPADYKLDFLAQYGMQMFRADSTHDYGPLLYQFIEASPRDGRFYALRGDYYMERGVQDSAYRMYRVALQHQKNFFPLWIRLIEMETEYQSYDSVIYHAEQALQMFPFEPSLYFYKGMSLNRLKRYAEAVDVLEESIPYATESTPLIQRLIYQELAESHYRLGNYDPAFEYFEKALRLEPHNPIILNNYAYYLAVVGRSLDKAQKMSAQSLKAEPDNPAFLDTYGWILHKKGRHAEAKKYIEQALRHRPTDPELLEHMGDVLESLGQHRQAVEYWKKALKHGGEQSILNEKIRRIRP